MQSHISYDDRRPVISSQSVILLKISSLLSILGSGPEMFQYSLDSIVHGVHSGNSEFGGVGSPCIAKFNHAVVIVSLTALSLSGSSGSIPPNIGSNK